MSQNDESFYDPEEFEDDEHRAAARNILVEQLIRIRRSLMEIDYVRTFSEGDEEEQSTIIQLFECWSRNIQLFQTNFGPNSFASTLMEILLTTWEQFPRESDEIEDDV